MNNIYSAFFGWDSKVRYRFPTDRRKRVLILAPHSDDESIGCGGTIFHLQKMGYQVVIVLFTLNDQCAERLQEFNHAMMNYKCSNYITFNFQDGRLNEQIEMAKKELQKIILRENPGIIFTPYLFDYHNDHRCVSKMLAESISTNDIYIVMYEVWTPILYPNYYIDISEFWDKKREALSCYHSQIKKYSILNKAEKLNKLRAELSMRRKVNFIEAFKGIEAEEFIHTVKALRKDFIL